MIHSDEISSKNSNIQEKDLEEAAGSTLTKKEPPKSSSKDPSTVPISAEAKPLSPWIQPKVIDPKIEDLNERSRKHGTKVSFIVLTLSLLLIIYFVLGLRFRSFQRQTTFEVEIDGSQAPIDLQSSTTFTSAKHVRWDSRLTNAPMHAILLHRTISPEVKVANESKASSLPLLIWFHGNSNCVRSEATRIVVREQNPIADVFLPEYPGYGQLHLQEATQINCVNAGVESIKYVLRIPSMATRPIFFYGHSLGGAVALETAEKWLHSIRESRTPLALSLQSRLSGIIIDNGVSSFTDIVRSKMPLALPFCNIVFIRDKIDSLSRIREIYEQSPPASAATAARNTFYHPPILFVVGGQDADFKPQSLKMFRKVMQLACSQETNLNALLQPITNGTQSTTALFQSNHCPQFQLHYQANGDHFGASRQPEAIFAIQKFINKDY